MIAYGKVNTSLCPPRRCSRSGRRRWSSRSHSRRSSAGIRSRRTASHNAVRPRWGSSAPPRAASARGTPYPCRSLADSSSWSGGVLARPRPPWTRYLQHNVMKHVLVGGGMLNAYYRYYVIYLVNNVHLGACMMHTDGGKSDILSRNITHSTSPCRLHTIDDVSVLISFFTGMVKC